jgi:hypothetical protein
MSRFDHFTLASIGRRVAVFRDNQAACEFIPRPQFDSLSHLWRGLPNRNHKNPLHSCEIKTGTTGAKVRLGSLKMAFDGITGVRCSEGRVKDGKGVFA